MLGTIGLSYIVNKYILHADNKKKIHSTICKLVDCAERTGRQNPIPQV